MEKMVIEPETGTGEYTFPKLPYEAGAPKQITQEVLCQYLQRHKQEKKRNMTFSQRFQGWWLWRGILKTK
jgi:hypothetical protein